MARRLTWETSIISSILRDCFVSQRSTTSTVFALSVYDTSVGRGHIHPFTGYDEMLEIAKTVPANGNMSCSYVHPLYVLNLARETNVQLVVPLPSTLFPSIRTRKSFGQITLNF